LRRKGLFLLEIAKTALAHGEIFAAAFRSASTSNERAADCRKRGKRHIRGMAMDAVKRDIPHCPATRTNPNSVL
jgi:hypothetical protein